MLTLSGRMVGSKDTGAAIESAYAKLSDGERAEIDELVDVLMRRMVRNRGVGEQAARQILGVIGIYLLEHPKIRARFDESGCFVGFTGESPPHVRQIDELERSLRFFRGN